MTENPNEAANLYSMTIHQDHIAGDVNPNSGVNGGGEGYAAMAEANGGGVEEEDDDDEVGMMDEDHHHHHQNHHQEHDHDGDLGSGAIGPHIVSGSQQLTLSFQGEVYVFDNVSPEKVQAVLLLLGGREVPTPVPSVPLASQQYNKGPNFPHRVASLMRFREKRKERNFDKKIRYTVRKEVALRMQRNKGQFTSSKSKIDDAAPGDTTLDATQRWGSVDGRPQAASECHHCGISSKSTPMMRRGPDGPRTLCNACGLMWANKGLLKDLSKSPTLPTQNTLPVAPVEGNGTTMTVSEQQPVAGTANGHDSLS